MPEGGSEVVNPEPLRKQIDDMLRKYPPSNAYKNVKPKKHMDKNRKSSNQPSSRS